MLSVRQELRDILENIYCNTIYDRFEIMEDNTTQNVIVTDWIDVAIQIAVSYQQYQGTPLVLKTISEIAVKEPYSEYKTYFEELDDTMDLRLEELLCKRNKYYIENNLKTTKDSIKMISTLVGTMREILPEGFINHDMKLQKENLENDIRILSEQKEVVISEIEKIEEELKEKILELENKKQEEVKEEKEKIIEELQKENDNLKQIISNGPGNILNAANSVSASTSSLAPTKIKKQKFAFTKKQKVKYLVDMMIQKRYTPDKISLVCSAKQNGANINELIKLVESNVDAGTLRETIKFLTNTNKEQRKTS